MISQMHFFEHSPQRYTEDFQLSLQRNPFLYVKVCTFWKCIEDSIYWDKTNMLKKFPLDKINAQKMHSFLSRAPTQCSFTFNLRFLNELKHEVWFYTFNSISFLLKFIFLFNKMLHELFGFKTLLFLSKLK